MSIDQSRALADPVPFRLSLELRVRLQRLLRVHVADVLADRRDDLVQRLGGDSQRARRGRSFLQRLMPRRRMRRRARVR